MKQREMQLKAAVSITEMARMLGFSRTRVYQLIRQGVFPTPMRASATSRPYFSQEQQEVCLNVKRSNLGVNGQVIMFYQARRPAPPRPSAKRASKNLDKSNNNRGDSDPVIRELRAGLKQLGLIGLTDESLEHALKTVAATGDPGDEGERLMAVYRHLVAENRQDKPSG